VHIRPPVVPVSVSVSVSVTLAVVVSPVVDVVVSPALSLPALSVAVPDELELLSVVDAVTVAPVGAVIVTPVDVIVVAFGSSPLQPASELAARSDREPPNHRIQPILEV
jgi:hypothetical protein